MKILAIGNSFSQDASRYLRSIARADGKSFKVVNLYIAGCSLWKHHTNLLEQSRAYAIQLDGESIGFYTSIQEALLSDEWDVVTLQQASGRSYDYETYQPYLDTLADCIRKCAPKAKIYIHETWAYESGSERLLSRGYENYDAMFKDVKNCYEKAAKEIGADGMIRSGELLQVLLKSGVPSVHRDTFHLSLGLGRYAVGLLWYATLTGRGVMENGFADFDEPIPEEYVLLIKKSVTELTKGKTR